MSSPRWESLHWSSLHNIQRWEVYIALQSNMSLHRWESSHIVERACAKALHDVLCWGSYRDVHRWGSLHELAQKLHIGTLYRLARKLYVMYSAQRVLKLYLLLVGPHRWVLSVKSFSIMSSSKYKKQSPTVQRVFRPPTFSHQRLFN